MGRPSRGEPVGGFVGLLQAMEETKQRDCKNALRDILWSIRADYFVE